MYIYFEVGMVFYIIIIEYFVVWLCFEVQKGNILGLMKLFDIDLCYYYFNNNFYFVNI